MTTVQNLTIIQRENLLKMIFNLTYGLNEDEMEALKGPSITYIDDSRKIHQQNKQDYSMGLFTNYTYKMVRKVYLCQLLL